jgi:hypothetical protein
MLRAGQGQQQPDLDANGDFDNRWVTTMHGGRWCVIINPVLRAMAARSESGGDTEHGTEHVAEEYSNSVDDPLG